MKSLLIDVGNTRLKWARSINNEIIERNLFAWKTETLEESLASQWRDLNQPDAIFVSNVAGDVIRDIISSWCETNWKTKPVFAAVTGISCGVSNSYPEVEKLGIDRWLAMIGAWNYCKKNVCIIDCGSAITVDVVNAKGLHQGGMISPGLVLSARALTDHTHALTAEQRKKFSTLANNTEDAINSGCYHQFIGGVQYMLKKIQQHMGGDVKYIITGGDAELILNALDLEMRYEPDLVLKGLYLNMVSVT